MLIVYIVGGVFGCLFIVSIFAALSLLVELIAAAREDRREAAARVHEELRLQALEEAHLAKWEQEFAS